MERAMVKKIVEPESASWEIETLRRQNEKLRKENEALKRKVGIHRERHMLTYARWIKSERVQKRAAWRYAPETIGVMLLVKMFELGAMVVLVLRFAEKIVP